MEEHKFCKIIEGIGATTEVDLHGDKLTLESLKSIKESINSENMRDVLFEHDENNKIGEIISCNIVKEGEGYKLQIKVGVLKGKEEYIDLIKNKILTGFSIGFLVGGNKNDLDNSQIKLEVPSSLRHEIEDILNKNQIKHVDYIKKAVDVSQIIGIVGGVGSLAGIISLIYEIYKNKKQKNNSTPSINIIINGNNNILNELNINEIESKIRDASKQ